MLECELLGQQSIPFTPQEPVTKQGNDRRPKQKTDTQTPHRAIRKTNKAYPTLYAVRRRFATGDFD
ncbi:MAG: hypothetical protein HOO98_17315 [Nitrospira sp.]|nr:hypothetical protein [Nitrospira sp.]